MKVTYFWQLYFKISICQCLHIKFRQRKYNKLTFDFAFDCKKLIFMVCFYETQTNMLISEIWFRNTDEKINIIVEKIHQFPFNFFVQRYHAYKDRWTVCSCHVTYAFQSESTLYSCLNVKELLARSRREIWRWSDCNWTRTQNHLVLKRTLNHLAKWNAYMTRQEHTVKCTIQISTQNTAQSFRPVWPNGWVFV